MNNPNSVVNNMLGKGADKSYNELNVPKTKTKKEYYNSNTVVKKLEKMLTSIPELEKATGKLKLELKDGQKQIVNLEYLKGGWKK